MAEGGVDHDDDLCTGELVLVLPDGLVELGQARNGAAFGRDVRSVDDDVGGGHVGPVNHPAARICPTPALGPHPLGPGHGPRRMRPWPATGAEKWPSCCSDDPQRLRQRRHARIGPRAAQRRGPARRCSRAPASTSRSMSPYPDAPRWWPGSRARRRGAPSLALLGHTDVVPANGDDWRHDPFGGELIDGEVWGRGAVDMLNLTASMAVALRHLADEGFRPEGDLLFIGVADEEALGSHGPVAHRPRRRRGGADYLITEAGGFPMGRSRRRPPPGHHRREGRLLVHHDGAGDARATLRSHFAPTTRW